MDDTNAFEKEFSFEEEFKKAKLTAVEYRVCELGEFRNNISDACIDAYEGRRSIQGFLKFATALITDEDGYFKQYSISADQLFINSLRSQDIDLELLREEERTTENAALLTTRKSNLTKIINGLVEQGAISTGLCKMYFSSQLLEDARIIYSKEIFDKRLIRLNTAMLYKQHKFNLLREDNEGYSGLANDLTISSIDNERDSKGKLAATPMEKIDDFINIIQSRIGVFNLDPNRVLDMILDFFITQMTVNYKFWVALIKQSGWIQKLCYTDAVGDSSAYPSAILAQLIGFRFYSYHENESAPPTELYLAIAILLKNGLILLGDILPHMSPNPDCMLKESQEYNSNMHKEVNSHGSGGLASYGMLSEEGTTERIKSKSTPSSQGNNNDGSTDGKANSGYKVNDVVQVVKALLSIGDLENAKIIFAMFGNLVEMYPQLAYDIYRLCSIVLEPVYETYVHEKTKDLYQHFGDCSYKSRMKSALSTPEDLNPKIPDQIELKRVLVTDALLNDVQDLNKRERYVFFYKEWREQLEFCKTFEDLTTKFMPLMRLAGYKTYLATDLIQKLVLIVGGLIESGEAKYPKSRIHCLNMLREFLLPAISFSGGNPGTMASIWEILCHFNYQERYALYGDWGTEFYKKNNESRLLKARVERSVKYVMRRVARNDIRRCGRDLGKLAHSNPMIVFSVVLDQVQSFSNMAPLMADACRYLGDFSYDVLGCVLTGKWTGYIAPGRTLRKKGKADGAPEDWLRSLAVFTGMLYKKQDIDSTPVLRYLSYRFRQNDSVSDLILLDEFVTKMGGFEIIESGLSDDQITAAGCSNNLKAEAFLSTNPDNRRAGRRALLRLKESLRRKNVGFEILLLLYKLEEACSSEIGVSAIDRCSNLERVHQSRLQYSELLNSLFEGEEYAALMPSVDVLVNDYALPLDIAMDFNRQRMKSDLTSNIDTPITPGEIWTPFKLLVDTVSSLLPDPPAPSMFTTEFYVVFWQLTLYDIYCPTECYQAAIDRHAATIRKHQASLQTAATSASVSAIKKAEHQTRKAMELLQADLPRHQAHVEKVMVFLRDSQSRWFPSPNHRINLVMNILQHCIFPRSKKSEVDAVYCYEFAMLMHSINARNFSTLTLIDKVLGETLPADFMAFSEYECRIHSRFISKALSKMGSWHADERKYIREAHGDGLIGFQKNWSSQPTENVAVEDLLNFGEFQRVLGKWHQKCYVVIEQALRSGEAHAIKNAVVLLSYSINYFPATKEHGDSISKIMHKLSTDAGPGKIKVLTASYIGHASKHIGNWVTRDAFTGQKEPSPPVDIKIQINGSNSKGVSTLTKEVSGSSFKTQTGEASKEETSSRRRDHTETSSSKHGSSSKPSSPSRKTGESSRISTSQTTTSPPLDRKRHREVESSHPEKSQRTDDGSSRHRSSNVTSSSSRNSPRESGTKESTSRGGTPLRSEAMRSRDTAKEAIREATRDTARDPVNNNSSSTRKESPRSRVPFSSHNNNAGSQNPPASASASATNMRSDERSSRVSRVSTNNAIGEPTSSSRHDDRRANNAAISSAPRSSSAGRSSSKRVIDSDREKDRNERPEKRRDTREERSRDDRARTDDRRDIRRNDERRNEDRRADDRRRDRHYNSGGSGRRAH